MSAVPIPELRYPVLYPDSDGEPLAENTLQYEWITTIKGGLDVVFQDNPLVFVAGDLLWYPVEGNNKLRTAPDSMVVFGRPKGYRGSYLQWLEDGIAPQVAFEVLSPGNRATEMAKKQDFYEQYGVEEYYIYDPDDGALRGLLRNPTTRRFEAIPQMEGWVSPRLNVRFHVVGVDLQLFGPDGRRFLSYVEMGRERIAAEQRADETTQQLDEATLLLDSATQRLDSTTQQLDSTTQRLDETNLRLDSTMLTLNETKQLLDQAARERDDARRRAEELEERLRVLERSSQ